MHVCVIFFIFIFLNVISACICRPSVSVPGSYEMVCHTSLLLLLLCFGGGEQFAAVLMKCILSKYSHRP